MDEEKTGRRLLSLLMAVVMVVSLAAGVPAGRLSRAYADSVQGPRRDGSGNVTWDRIYFGGYPQTDATGVVSDAIMWRVLSVNGTDALLQADCNLDTFYYYRQNAGITWASSLMRSWLNGYTQDRNLEGENYYYDRSGFIYRAFTEAERAAILETDVITAGNPSWHTADEETVSDKVFLLSYEESVNPDYGFSASSSEGNPARVRKNTAYVAAGGTTGASVEEAAGEAGYWWLRTAGIQQSSRLIVLKDGTVNLDGAMGFYQMNSVCPAIHLNLADTSLWSYAGTISSNGVSTTGAQPPTDEQRHAGDDKSKIVTGIEASKTKIYYKKNDTWNTSDIEVTVHYADNHSDTVEPGLCSISEPDLKTTGVKQVAVVYKDKSAVLQITVYDPLEVTTQPQSRSVKAGDKATFTVAALGGMSDVITYQWEYSVSGKVWNTLEGATAAAFTTPALRTTDSGKQYRCKVTNDKDTVFSEAATVTVGTETVTHTGHDAVVAYDGSSMIDVSQYFELDPRVSDPVYSLVEGSGYLIGTMLSAYVAGIFVVKVTTYAQDGYEEASATAVLTVREGGIVCNAAGYSGEYDGKEHGITVTVTKPENATITYGTDGKTYASAELKYSACGEYTVYYKVECDNYDAVTGSAKVKITPQTAEIKAKNQQIIAGGSISLTAYTASLQKGDKVSSVTLVTVPESTDRICNDGTITPGSAKIVNASGKDVTGSYQLTYTPGVLKILHDSKLKPDGIRVEKEKTEYQAGDTVLLDDLKVTAYYSDGYEQEVEDYTTNLDQLNPVTAGEQILKVSWTGNSKTVTAQIKLTVSSNAPQHLGVNGDISCQSGDMVDAAQYFVLDPLAGEASYFVTDPAGTKRQLSGTQFQVKSEGAYTLQVTTAAKGSCQEGSASAVLNVHISEIGFTAAGYSGIYDGASHGIRVSLASSAEGCEIYYSADGNAFAKELPVYSHAGSWKTWYQIRQGEEVKESGTCTVQIEKRPLSIRAKDQTVLWGVEPGKEYLAEGLVSGDEVSAITCVPGTTELTENGTVTFSQAVVKRGDEDITDSYAITYQAGVLKIQHDTTLTPERMLVEKKVTAYSVGQTLNLDDITVTLEYKDGFQEDGSGKVTVSSNEVNMKKAGTYAIVVTSRTNSSLVSKIEITVASGPVILEQPEDVAVKAGEKTVFSVKAESGGEISYQWLSSADGKTWKELSGETEPDYEIEAATADMDGRRYQCRLKDSSGTITTSQAVLTVERISVVNKAREKELSLNYDAVEGKEVELSQYFVMGTGAGTPSYKWRLAGEETLKSLSGGTMRFTQTGTYEIFLETAESGNYASSEPVSVKLTVKEGILQYTVKPVKVDYDGQPHSLELSVTTPGAAVAYCGSDVDQEPAVDAYQAKMPQFTEAGTYYVYYRISKDNYKEVKGSETVVILLEETPDIPVITKQPEDLTVLTGSPAVLSLKAESGQELLYQWMMDRGDGNGWNPIEGAVSDTFTTAALESSEDGIRYRCQVSNDSGLVMSDTIQVTVMQIPVNNTGSTVTLDYARVKDAPLDIRPYFTLDENAGTPVYRLAKGTNAVLNGTMLTVRGTGTFEIGLQTAENGRYAAGKEVFATLEIAEGVIENIVSDVTVTYDGLPHSLKPDYDGSEDVQILYYCVNNAEEQESAAPVRFSPVVPSLTDVGSYTVYYRIVKPNYQTAEGAGKVTIEKRAITIVANDQTILAGGQLDQTAFTLKRSTLAENDQIKELVFAPAPSDLSMVGSGKLFISGARIFSGEREVTDNYSITYVPGNYTVVHDEGTAPDRISATMEKAIYKVGEKPDLEGLKVLAVYGDGHSVEVEGYTTNAEELELSSVGLYKLKVTWTGYGKTFQTEILLKVNDGSGDLSEPGGEGGTEDPSKETVTFVQEGFLYSVIASDDGVNRVSVGVSDGTVMENAKIPETVTHEGVEYQVAKLSQGAFSGHQELSVLEIPSSVTTIGENALSGTGLHTVNIPSSVKVIEGNAFSGCGQLETLNFEGTEAPALSQDALGGIPEGVVITVPAGSTGYREQEALSGREPVEVQPQQPAVEQPVEQPEQPVEQPAVLKPLTALELAANREKLNRGTVVKWKGNGIKVSWGKISGADGYDIFAAPAGVKYKNPDKTAGAGAKSAGLSKACGAKLNASKLYHVRVRAYRVNGGKKEYIATGKDYYVAGAKNKKYTNVKSVRVKKGSFTLAKGKSAQIRATAVKEKKNRKLLPAKYGKTISYSSSAPSVAVVSAKGKVTAKKKGTCNIFVTAVNGVSKKVKVKVK